MQEILRLKIKNTEEASIEVIPTDEGVEIVVFKKPGAAKETTEKKFNGGKSYGGKKVVDNLTILKDFCHEKNEELKWDKTMKAELLKFYKWYEERADEWKGTIQPEKLWARWQETRGAK